MVTTVASTLRTFLVPFAQYFRAKGWRVDGLAAGAPEVPELVEAFDRVWDMPWSRHPLDFRNLTVASELVRRIVVEHRYDIVHTHTPVASFATRFALRQSHGQPGGPRIVYTAHGFHFHENGPALQNALFLKLEQLGGRWTDHLVVMNQADFEAATRFRLVPADRLHYIQGIGVDTARFAPEQVPPELVAEIHSELHLARRDRLYLMIAEFNPGKRHRDALRALALLGRPDVHMAFAGVGKLVEPMQKLAADLGLVGQVHFLGYRRDVAALIRASVATVLPSEREGLPRSVMESLSLKVPVIGTDIRGVRDLVGSDRGILVPVGDHQGLADAMERLACDRCEAEAMGERGRAYMASFDIRQVLRLYEELYHLCFS